MGNIFETVSGIQRTEAVGTLSKTRTALAIEASSPKGSQVFDFVRIDVLKVPTLSAGIDDGELVIDLNVDRLRQTSAGFIPKLVILSGAERLRAAKRMGASSCNAWVGKKVFGKHKILSSESIPKADIAAASKDIAALTDKQENILMDGRNFAAPALGGFNGTNKPFSDMQTDYGAPGSELNNPMLKLMLNVEDALEMYQTESATGIHKVIYSPYAPIPGILINAAREASIAAK